MLSSLSLYPLRGDTLSRSRPQNNFIQIKIKTKNSTVTQNTGMMISRAARANKPEDQFPVNQRKAASKRPVRKLHTFHIDTILSTRRFGVMSWRFSSALPRHRLKKHMPKASA
jgi:hypothetical protein